MKKVLVTGANGQLGKTIEELYKNNSVNLDFFFVAKEDLDITNKDKLNIFFSKNSFDYCINCAAYTNVEQAEKTPKIAFKINAEGVKNLAEKCNEKDIVLIHISTDYVFDGKKEEPYVVTDRTNPINEYGKSKLLGEEYVKSVMSKYFIIRTSWLYSKIHGNNFYKSILKKAREGKELFVTNEQKSCPTNTENLAKYIVALITKNLNNFGLIHFSDDDIMSWHGFAVKILQENKLFAETTLVEIEKYHTFATRPKNSILKNIK